MIFNLAEMTINLAELFEWMTFSLPELCTWTILIYLNTILETLILNLAEMMIFNLAKLFDGWL